MIYLGKLLTKEDLNVFFYNSDGVMPIDPYYVSYTMFDCTHGRQEIIRQTINSLPMKFDNGSYFVPIHLDPKVFRPGRHIIQWSYKKFQDTELQMVSESFDVIMPTKYAGEFCRSTYAREKIIM
jgi:hypothetical protein